MCSDTAPPVSREPADALSPKPVAASLATLNQMIFPRDTNELDMATAGVIMKSIDITASVTAARHSGKLTVTASLDEMNFTNPAKLWEIVSTQTRLTKTWRTSMEIEVKVIAENTRTGQSRCVAKGYLVFVAIDEDTAKPTGVPPLQMLTDEEETLARNADIRRTIRLGEKAQLAHHSETEIDDTDLPQTVLRTMTPDDANIHFNVFGGIILEMIHQAAEKAAFRHVNGPVIAVRQDRMSFEQPAYIGEEVQAFAVITRTWNTSMEILVDVTARDHKTREVRKVASSFLVFIAQDPEGKPKPVPAYTPLTAKQKQRWQEADIRRNNRLLSRTVFGASC